ncbi:ParB/RepB/Spo0J family partition protein [Aurantiacibacter aquimixticola]|uniref:ParB/RepB/Spo0J family partition protein n=1 Tax=Aurantiacibacter aquimixticola TaxID=1958945 RepID=A0A419RNG5_9SPHN|nr:ParB/RepB/Spo0J family partition protein [Aurantiacibacter aquimixticola]RJY06934.1 ParB/RepB/Spo0J family partition protein [Aurantiacibacter aquimixticola]
MAKKQKDYLADLLADDEQNTDKVERGAASPAPASRPNRPFAPSPKAKIQLAGSQDAKQRERARGTTLLSRESALARVATGEVRQVTQLVLDPARVRVWPGNARSYEHLTEANCRELIDSIIAEGGQKVPAIVRRVEGDADHDYEVIAGTRRHWSISWLRANSYPDIKFVAQVADLDNEAAFRLADLENRARKDVSDLERARNYADALKAHYGNHLTRMAERLKLSKGWLSKMLKVASIPDSVIAAFASPAEVQLKPSYPLAQAMVEKDRAAAIRKAAGRIAKEQAARQAEGQTPLPSADVIARLLAAGQDDTKPEKLTMEGAHGRPALTVQSSNRQGVTFRLHSGHGLSEADLLETVREALCTLNSEGRGLQR